MSISVDGVERNAAMVEKLLLSFPLLADTTAAVADAWGVYDASAKIARPAIFVIGRDLSIPYKYVGRDFADRPPLSELFSSLEAVAEREPRPLTWSVSTPGPREPRDSGRRHLPFAELAPYLRGANFGVAALAGRTDDPGVKAEAKRYQAMLAEFLKYAAATERLLAEARQEEAGRRV